MMYLQEITVSIKSELQDDGEEITQIILLGIFDPLLQ